MEGTRKRRHPTEAACVRRVGPYPEVTKKPTQAPAVAAFSAVALALTFLPEALDAWERRGRAAAGRRRIDGERLELRLKLANVGCTACAVSVRAALEASPMVASVVSVDVNDATAVVELASRDDAKDAKRAAAARRHLIDVLRRAGHAEVDGSNPASAEEEPPHLARAVLGGLLGSSCCAVQLGINGLASVGGSLGVGCAGFNKTLGPLRPLTRTLTAAYFAWAWVRALSSGASPFGSLKNNHHRGIPSSRRRGASGGSLRSLAVSSAVCAALTFLPELLLVTGGPALAAPTAGARRVELAVEGMGCEACQTHVRQTLLSSAGSGVLDATADFTTGRASVWVNERWRAPGVTHSGFDLDRVRTALAEMGYELRQGKEGGEGRKGGTLAGCAGKKAGADANVGSGGDGDDDGDDDDEDARKLEL